MLRELVYNELMGLGKTEAVAKEWGAVAAEFEQVCGQKKKYARADVISFLAHLRKRKLLQSTIHKDLKAIKVVARAQGWGAGPKGEDFPKLPLIKVDPDEIKRTIFSADDVASLIMMGKRILSQTELCYLALSTVYGLRRIEMFRLKAASFPNECHLTVHTAKGGRKTIHLIPPEIAPYLEAFTPYQPDTLTHMFHRIAVATGLKATGGYGWHSIRRSLATELVLSETSSINVMWFMRWTEASIKRELGMLAIYAKKD
ncbi:unnamed protein product, partial [marine sediment metagenome]